MKCPKCGAESHVLSTRENKQERLDRRRICFGPEKHRFTTTELTTEDLAGLSVAAFRLERLRLLIQEKL